MGLMKPSFLTYEKPILTTMIQTKDPESGFVTMEKALAEGTEAFGYQICRLDPRFRTPETYKKIMQGYC